MSEQQENELICAKLLKWKRVGDADFPAWEQCTAYWLDGITGTTPTFTTWADAGLILDALAAQWPASKVFFRALGGSMVLGGLTAPEIRDAALEYIRVAGEVGASR